MESVCVGVDTVVFLFVLRILCFLLFAMLQRASQSCKYVYCLAFHPCWYFLLHMPGCVMFVSAFLSEYSSPLLSIPAVLCIFAGSTLRFVGFCRRYTLREAWRKRYCLWLFVATSSGDESQMQMLCCIVHTPAPLYRRNCFYYFDFCCLGWRQ